MSSHKPSKDSSEDTFQDDATEALTPANSQELEAEQDDATSDANLAPAPGYVYASPDEEVEEPEETDELFVEEGAAGSLSHQLLRKGETIDKEQIKEEKRAEKEEKRKQRERAVLGTAVGGLVGSRASDGQLNDAGKPVLPTESRTSEVTRKKTSKGGLGFMAIAAVAALAVGGMAAGIPLIQEHQQEKVSSEQPASEEPSPSAAPSATMSPAPVPSIINRVPEVKYVDHTDQAVEPGSVEYMENTEEEVVEEVPVATQAPVETAEPLVTEAPAPVATEVAPEPALEAPVETEVPEETFAPEPTVTETTAPVQTLEPTSAPAEAAPASTLPTAPASEAQTEQVAPSASTQGEQVAPESAQTGVPGAGTQGEAQPAATVTP